MTNNQAIEALKREQRRYFNAYAETERGKLLSHGDELIDWLYANGHLQQQVASAGVETLTDEWLGEIGFKWSQEERQPSKHWRLTLGWGAPNTRVCMEDLSIEVSSGAMNGEWFCWLQRGTGFSGNFLHVRGIKYRHELIEIITALTGTKFKLKNCMYGNFYNDELTAKMRPDYDAIKTKEQADD